VRLVLADPKDPHQPFPIEVYTRNNPGLLTTDSIMPSRLQIAEISRFSLINNFQRHLGIEWPSEDRRKGIPTLTYRQDKKTMPYAILGLCIASIRMSAEHNITHWYTMMEPTLTKLLGNFGFCFDPIGPAIECLGRIRRPYLTPIDKSLAGVYRNYKDIWELMTDNETLSAKPSIPFPAPLYY
jgi:N-acyl amino acid synthase of PEP-CTERM/exosortase system